uniref:4-hydroxybenzoate polyprenyltransferase n=1 Tax=uncultured bacterium contig00163 TaxID=1181594 RepID=A0A806K2W6_9BACT|nr:4-hydroxybenzoate polyprenyltransferase [uncultured bacterium contig00163]
MENNPGEQKPQEVSKLKRFRELLDMIKFEHTAFALPFAFIGALAASGVRTPWLKYFWILAAMVGARTLAMTFNRIADADLDAENPRTSDRAIPKGRIKLWHAWLMVGISAALFGLAAAMLGPLPAKLAPYAFIVLLGYSFTKRFTVWSHAILGLALSMAPLGAWIAVTGRIEMRDLTPALWLSLGVLSWTTGFDVIYALADRAFDREKGLRSIPVELGVHPALVVSRTCHVLAVFSWAVFLWYMNATFFPWLSLAIVAGILFREQWVMKDGSLDRLDHAFFTLNSFVGVVLFLGYFLHWLKMRGTI